MTPAPRPAGMARLARASDFYGPEDRQALALLMLPFFLLAFAIGSGQALRRSATVADAPVAAAPATPDSLREKARNGAFPAVAVGIPEVREAQAAAPSGSVPAAPALAGAEARAADMRSAEATPSLDVARSRADPAVPASLDLPPATQSRVAAASPPPAAAVAVADGVAVPAAAPTAAAAVPVSPAPVEIAALPPALAPSDTLPPGSDDMIGVLPPRIGGAAPNVCTRSAEPPANAGRTRLAALQGLTSDGTMDPIAFGMELAKAAREQLDDFTVYTDKYRSIAYPGGDVPQFYGVCTDVIIRAYRALGVDLQEMVHVSRLGSGDTNIDHRRVGTLQKFFSVYGQSIPVSEFAEDYWPGDIVSYYRPQNRHSRSHIAVVSDVVGPSGNFMIIHNRGWGPQMEDGLFVDQITGHYRYSLQKRPGVPTARATRVQRTSAPVTSNPASADALRGSAAADRLPQ